MYFWMRYYQNNTKSERETVSGQQSWFSSYPVEFYVNIDKNLRLSRRSENHELYPLPAQP